ncbi:MAG: hypothetical protein ABI811_11520 [Acidobacteriota bacterium]
MFHWICPECGREIAPQAKECAACDPLGAAASALTEPAVAAPAEPTPPVAASIQASLPVTTPPLLLLAAPEPPAVPEPVIAPPPMQARIPGSPKPPASSVPAPILPAGQDLSPVAAQPLAPPQPPSWTPECPIPSPASAAGVPSAPIRAPKPAAPSAKHSAAISAAGPEPPRIETCLPQLMAAPIPQPPLGDLAPWTAATMARIQPVRSLTKPAASLPVEHISLPGPTLPHELTSLEAAGIGRILVVNPDARSGQGATSWFVSFAVASALFAGVLATAFYAIPSLASPGQASTKAPVEQPKPQAVPIPRVVVLPSSHPLARYVEVTGVRFITDPEKSPEIHYLVVNHSGTNVAGLNVSVTLRSGPDQFPLTQFSFRAPNIGPYESREMVSYIKNMNRSVPLPDWQDVHAETQIAQ